ncbi:hypothetical protein B0J13DRAFT_679252 [Dactylonectria estremocensis]|uniref:AttH domain-containing protein n=1 Tax=Dactylonectria estremocensis TaxID=1079267 RepID=A0A9P9E2K2_9HYPO|nr:hypothetical protein B0J13DRAFT_679252 [Dactylonectria estremocensis]
MFSVRKFVLAVMPVMVLGRKFLRYHPEDLPVSYGDLDDVPGLFDLAASLTKAQNASVDSWWTSTYATSYNGDNYLVITHMIQQSSGVTTRSAVLDLTTYAYSQTQNISQNSTFYNPTTGLADLKGPGFTMKAISDTNPLVGFHVETNVPDVHINLTFNTRSPALVNGGTGAFVLSGILSYEWAIPEARTSGTLTVNGTEIELDPNHSITWFDRQWGGQTSPIVTTKSSTGAASWHWFQLHISSCGSCSTTKVLLSGWVVTYENGPKAQFATVRQSPGVQQVLAISSMDATGRTWTSPYTNITYEQDFKLKLGDGSYFKLAVVTEDQEMHSDNGASPAYEGYLEFTGIYQGHAVSGFGLVEIVKSF